MLIRSQDKNKLAMFEGASVDEGCNRVYVNGWKFGEYSTEEKAIKVLDMIQEEYGRHIYGEGGQMATVYCYVPPFAFIPPKVFQMPKDDDVEV